MKTKPLNRTVQSALCRYRSVGSIWMIGLANIEENRCNLADMLQQMAAYWNINTDNFQPVTSFTINEDKDKEEED